jgi:acetylornithine deacetylase/succinyl-diaminopimelate desuccinylase-like protein
MAFVEAVAASRAHRAKYGSLILSRFMELAAMPNITGDVPALDRLATELVARLAQKRADARAVRLDGVAPVVIGTISCPEPRRRLGIYAHYDGQPVDEAQWSTPPFEPTLRDSEGGVVPMPGPGGPVDPEWRLHARGTADDRAPIAALLGALEALAAAGLERTTELVFLLEGQEESGSPDLRRYLDLLAPDLAADLWLICDGPVHPTGAPQVVYGVRGYCSFELTVYGPERELHSGHFGNWVPNPAHALALVLAGMKDGAGRVLIGGFDATTQPVTDADRAAIASLPPVEEQYREDLGFAGSEGTDDRYAEALLRPTFNIRGLTAATTGDDARNVIPERATASVDIRLAAGNDPSAMLDLVELHLAGMGYVVLDREPTAGERRRHRNLARLERDIGYPAARADLDLPEAEYVAAAAEAAGGSDVVRIPTFGGSVPLHHFIEALDAPVVILPIANYDNNQHGPDENVRIGNLWYGMDVFSALLAG